MVVVALEELVHAKQLMIAKNERQDSPFSLSLSLYIYVYVCATDEKGEYRSAFLALKMFLAGFFFC